MTSEQTEPHGLWWVIRASGVQPGSGGQECESRSQKGPLLLWRVVPDDLAGSLTVEKFMHQVLPFLCCPPWSL